VSAAIGEPAGDPLAGRRARTALGVPGSVRHRSRPEGEIDAATPLLSWHRSSVDGRAEVTAFRLVLAAERDRG
jgi:hypothetical protein